VSTGWMVWWKNPCAIWYNVYKITAPRLLDADHDGVAEEYGLCSQPHLDSNQMMDQTSPPPGQTSYYVVTGGNLLGEGSMGYASNGLPRPNVAPCP